jgi:hypothetical protein
MRLPTTTAHLCDAMRHATTIMRYPAAAAAAADALLVMRQQKRSLLRELRHSLPDNARLLRLITPCW